MGGLALYGAGFVGELVVLGCVSTSVANPLLCWVWELAEEDRGQTHGAAAAREAEGNLSRQGAGVECRKGVFSSLCL